MTHTLHPDIQDAVDKLVAEITKLKPWYYNADCLYDLERMILKCVGKYLYLPKDKEPNYDAACMYVIANGLKITAADVKWILKAATVEDNESVPKIEKIDMEELSKFIYSGSDLEWNAWGSDMPAAIKMIANTHNTLIDYITNTLPPIKS